MRKLFSGLWNIFLSPIGVVVGVTAIWHFALYLLAIPIHLIPSLISFVIDLVVVYLLYDRWAYFFSQFVLPVQSPEERLEIYRRVRSGAGGPALFIRNGVAVAGEGEEKKRGSGVIMVDTASAAVLRTDSEIRATIGPGITFTRGGEYLAGTVDLREQFQTIGPIPGDQPFAANENLLPGTQAEVQKRRQDTTGLTRDGFEVVPSISIRFSVRKPERDSSSPKMRVHSEYGYSPEAVTKAVVRKLVQTGSSNSNGESHLPWNQLPAHLAINLWREYVRKFKFSELFTSDKISGLQTIEEMINKRMQEKYVVELSDTGVPTGNMVHSMESEHLLNRGIQVDEVHIISLYFDPTLENKIISTWEANWLSNARKEQKRLEEWEALLDTSAREDAVKIFAELASKPFISKARLSGNPFISLQLLFQNLKDAIVNGSRADSQLESELRKMEEFSKWLKDNNAAMVFGGKEKQE